MTDSNLFQNINIMADQDYKNYKQDVNYPRFNFDDVLAMQCCMGIVKEDKELYEQLQNLHDRIHDAYWHDRIHDTYWLEKQNRCNISPDEIEALRIAAYEPTKNWSEKLQSLYEKLIGCGQKPTNNIESKFKAGDWIVGDNTHDVYKVLCAVDDKYCLSYNIDGNVICTKAEIIDKKCHLWSIEDAKDGDVLVFDDAFILIFKEKGDPYILFPTKKTRGFNFKSHVFLDFLMNVFEQGSFCDDKGNKCHPATKEQRIGLFAIMKEYGYEWDSEKKMLTKIEQKHVSNFNKHIQAGDEIVTNENGERVNLSQLNRVAKPRGWISWPEKQDEMKSDINDDILLRFAFYQYDDNTLYLSSVFVEECNRKRGYGSKILKAAEKVAKTFGISKIRLKVETNSWMEEWYKRNGYEYLTSEGKYDWLEKQCEQTPIPIVNDWIEDYWQHSKVNNPDSYDGGDEIQFDHDGFVRFCNTYCNEPDWSEEDNKMLNNVIHRIEALDHYWNRNEPSDEKMIDWLKSFKERYGWKPSKEQIIALRWVLNNVPYNKHKEEISGLLDQLTDL